MWQAARPVSRSILTALDSVTVRPCDILGRTWGQLNAALLAAVTAHQVAQAGHPAAQS
jgi:hypothetical protein